MKIAPFRQVAGLLCMSDQAYSFSIRNDLKIDSIENLWIETNDMIVGVIYKPPNFSNPEFLDKLERTLHNVFLSKKKNAF